MPDQVNPPSPVPSKDVPEDSPPNLADVRAMDHLPPDPLGIDRPLLGSTPLGIPLLQPKFIKPLGMSSLGKFNGTVPPRNGLYDLTDLHAWESGNEFTASGHFISTHSNLSAPPPSASSPSSPSSPTPPPSPTPSSSLTPPLSPTLPPSSPQIQPKRTPPNLPISQPKFPSPIHNTAQGYSGRTPPAPAQPHAHQPVQEFSGELTNDIDLHGDSAETSYELPHASLSAEQIFDEPPLQKASDVGMSDIGGGNVDAPNADIPNADIPNADIPDVDAPNANVSNADVSGVDGFDNISTPIITSEHITAPDRASSAENPSGNFSSIEQVASASSSVDAAVSGYQQFGELPTRTPQAFENRAVNPTVGRDSRVDSIDRAIAPFPLQQSPSSTPSIDLSNASPLEQLPIVQSQSNQIQTHSAQTSQTQQIQAKSDQLQSRLQPQPQRIPPEQPLSERLTHESASSNILDAVELDVVESHSAEPRTVLPHSHSALPAQLRQSQSLQPQPLQPQLNQLNTEQFQGGQPAELQPAELQSVVEPQHEVEWTEQQPKTLGPSTTHQVEANQPDPDQSELAPSAGIQPQLEQNPMGRSPQPASPQFPSRPQLQSINLATAKAILAQQSGQTVQAPQAKGPENQSSEHLHQAHPIQTQHPISGQQLTPPQQPTSPLPKNQFEHQGFAQFKSVPQHENHSGHEQERVTDAPSLAEIAEAEITAEEITAAEAATAAGTRAEQETRAEQSIAPQLIQEISPTQSKVDFNALQRSDVLQRLESQGYPVDGFADSSPDQDQRGEKTPAQPTIIQTSAESHANLETLRDAQERSHDAIDLPGRSPILEEEGAIANAAHHYSKPISNADVNFQEHDSLAESPSKRSSADILHAENFHEIGNIPTGNSPDDQPVQSPAQVQPKLTDSSNRGVKDISSERPSSQSATHQSSNTQPSAIRRSLDWFRQQVGLSPLQDTHLSKRQDVAVSHPIIAQPSSADRPVAQTAINPMRSEQRGVTQEGVTQEGMAQEGMAQEGVTQEGVVQEASEPGLPDEVSLHQSWSHRVSPDQVLPDQVSPEIPFSSEAGGQAFSIQDMPESGIHLQRESEPLTSSHIERQRFGPTGIDSARDEIHLPAQLAKESESLSPPAGSVSNVSTDAGSTGAGLTGAISDETNTEGLHVSSDPGYDPTSPTSLNLIRIKAADRSESDLLEQVSAELSHNLPGTAAEIAPDIGLADGEMPVQNRVDQSTSIGCVHDSTEPPTQLKEKGAFLRVEKEDFINNGGSDMSNDASANNDASAIQPQSDQFRTETFPNFAGNHKTDSLVNKSFELSDSTSFQSERLQSGETTNAHANLLSEAEVTQLIGPLPLAEENTEKFDVLSDSDVYSSTPIVEKTSKPPIHQQSRGDVDVAREDVLPGDATSSRAIQNQVVQATTEWQDNSDRPAAVVDSDAISDAITVAQLLDQGHVIPQIPITIQDLRTVTPLGAAAHGLVEAGDRLSPENLSPENVGSGNADPLPHSDAQHSQSIRTMNPMQPKGDQQDVEHMGIGSIANDFREAFDFGGHVPSVAQNKTHTQGPQDIEDRATLEPAIGVDGEIFDLVQSIHAAAQPAQALWDGSSVDGSSVDGSSVEAPVSPRPEWIPDIPKNWDISSKQQPSLPNSRALFHTQATPLTSSSPQTQRNPVRQNSVQRKSTQRSPAQRNPDQNLNPPFPVDSSNDTIQTAIQTAMKSSINPLRTNLAGSPGDVSQSQQDDGFQSQQGADALVPSSASSSVLSTRPKSNQISDSSNAVSADAPHPPFHALTPLCPDSFTPSPSPSPLQVPSNSPPQRPPRVKIPAIQRSVFALSMQDQVPENYSASEERIQPIQRSPNNPLNDDFGATETYASQLERQAPNEIHKRENQALETFTKLAEQEEEEQEQSDGTHLELLAREIYAHLRQRLAIERERRQGQYYLGRLPW